jgi:hypothetical protein
MDGLRRCKGYDLVLERARYLPRGWECDTRTPRVMVPYVIHEYLMVVTEPSGNSPINFMPTSNAATQNDFHPGFCYSSDKIASPCYF